MSSEKPDDNPSVPYISAQDLEGLRKRAEREGKSIEDLELRPSIDPDAEPVADERDVVGILDRVVREKKPVTQLNLRGYDDTYTIFRTMRELMVKAGFPVKAHDSDKGRIPTGRISETELDALEAGEESEGEESEWDT